MRSLKIGAVAVPLCLILFSCGNSGNSEQGGKGINIDEVINSRSTDPDAQGDNECLLDHQQKYDALLSESDVIAATGFSGKTPETDYNKVLKSPEYHGFKYKFKNGRKGKVKGLDIEMELPDVVEVRSIKPMSLNTFRQSYKVVTDEQMQAAKEVLNDLAEGDISDADADAALKKAKEQNISKEQIKKTGGGVMDVIKEVSGGYRAVDGLGDAACWNVVTNELAVLQNGVKFDLFVEISNDNEKNRSVAIKLAEVILNKCK